MWVYWWEVGFMISRAFCLSMSTYHITKYCSKYKKKFKKTNKSIGRTKNKLTAMWPSYRDMLPLSLWNLITSLKQKSTDLKIERFTKARRHIMEITSWWWCTEKCLKALVSLKHSSCHHGRDCTSQKVKDIACWAIIETTCLDDWYWPR